MTNPPAGTPNAVEEARESLELFVRQVADLGALAVKEGNGRGLSLYANRFAAAVRAEEEMRIAHQFAQRIRAATLAEVRRVFDEEFTDDCNPAIGVTNFRCALDTLEGK